MTPHLPNTPRPALLVLGSNLGDRLGCLRFAVAGLGMVGLIDAVSPVYESPPAGHVHQGPFLNLALRLTTALGPVRLLMWGKGLEFAAGRRPGIPYGPRPLDVDIVSLGALEMANGRVSIPHPRVAERAVHDGTAGRHCPERDSAGPRRDAGRARPPAGPRGPHASGGTGRRLAGAAESLGATPDTETRRCRQCSAPPRPVK